MTSPFQPLLFRHVCLLAAMTGMQVNRYPLYGILACALLALLTLPLPARLPNPGNSVVFPSPAVVSRHALFFIFFCLGLAFAVVTDAPPSPGRVPGWVAAAVTPDGGQSSATFSQGLSVVGIVDENTALGGGRVRLILKDVRAPGEGAPLPGSLVLTWQSPPPEIVAAGPGQRLSATLRIRNLHGFANPGVWETEQYWRDRGAYFRAWAKGDGSRNGKVPPYFLEGEASLLWRLRNGLRGATLAVLEKNGEEATPSQSGLPGLSQAAGIIPALLFGERSFLTQETLDRVAKSTLAHSLALSGMHLGFAAGLGYGAASLLQLLFPSLFLRLPRQKAGLLLALPGCVAYLWMGGAPPSLIRAALMLLLWGVLLWLHRPRVLVDGLIWAVAFICIASPAALFDIRLQLSAVSVAGIALITPILQRLAQAIPDASRDASGLRGFLLGNARRLCLAIAGMALISIAAQAAILPVILNAFPGTGVWFPLNLVWLPVLGAWVMPLAFAGLFMTAVGLPAAASMIFSLAEVPCAGLLSLLHHMDAAGILIAPAALRPTGMASAGYWLLLLLLPVIYSARAFTGRTLFLLFTGLALASGPSLYPILEDRRGAVHLQLLDVGQGQSVVLSWKSRGRGGRMLIDGGGFPSSGFDMGRQIVSPVLTDNRPPRLDWIVNSHPDADHLQGVLFPMETFAVGRVAFGPDALTAKPTRTVMRRDEALARRGITPLLWQAGETVALAPDLSVEVLHPGDTTGLSSNDSALVLRIVWRGRPLALVCGDVERKGLNLLLDRAGPLRADVLVLPHHGSAGSYNPKLYDAVRPKVALVSCGYANQWHFPAQKIRDALAERGIPLAATADKGQIRIEWNEDGAMTVRFAREPGRCRTPDAKTPGEALPHLTQRN